MRPALAPVQTRARESAPHRSRGVNVDSEALQCFRAIGCEIVDVRAFRARGQPAQRLHTIVEEHANRARQVVVAGPRQTQPIRRGWNERVAIPAGKNAEAFERARDVGTAQAVEPMLPLRHEADQIHSPEAIEMSARGRGADARHDGELGGGAGAAVDKGVQDSGTRRLTNGRCDLGNGGVDAALCRHISIIDKSLMSIHGRRTESAQPPQQPLLGWRHQAAMNQLRKSSRTAFAKRHFG
jgi:hypothetical protein